MWQIRPGLESLKSYHLPEVAWPVKLDANERAGSLPPAVLAGLAERLAAVPVSRYPEIAQHSLKGALGADHGVTAANVAVGNGSSEILAALCRAFGGPGHKIVFPSPSFSMYPIYARLADSQPLPVELDAGFVLAPEKVFTTALREQASLIILCNPNNPTGGTMDPQALEYIVAGARCPVVVDEAYYEFYGESALGLLGRYPNLVVVRTFSKAYGLAATRVGYALAGEEIIALMNKMLLPYHMNALSLAAAEMVWAMRGEFTAGLAETVTERQRVAASLAARPGVEVFPSATNFLLFRTAQAKELAAYLATMGIGIRDFSSSKGLDGCLRVTIGTAAENDAFLAAVTEFIGEVGR